MRDPYNEIRRCVYDRAVDGWRPETEPARVFHGSAGYLILDEPPARFEAELRLVGRADFAIRPILGLDHGPEFRLCPVVTSAADFETRAKGGEYPDFYAIRFVKPEAARDAYPDGVCAFYGVDLGEAEEQAEAIARTIGKDYAISVKVGGVVGINLSRPLPRPLSVQATFLRAIAARDQWYERAQRTPAERPVSTRTRFLVLRRDDYRCKLCGATAADGATLHVDHKLARSKGGTNDDANLWTLCAPCNLGKSNLSL